MPTRHGDNAAKNSNSLSPPIPHVSLPLSSNAKPRNRPVGNGPHSQRDGIGSKDLTTSSVKRVGLRSPLFARRTIFFATDVAMGASRSARFNRFKASSKAAVMAAVSSGPNAVLIACLRGRWSIADRAGIAAISADPDMMRPRPIQQHHCSTLHWTFSAKSACVVITDSEPDGFAEFRVAA
jgi:hypothetical protein